MMPVAKIAKAKSPRIGRGADAAAAEVWMSSLPEACSVAAVVMIGSAAHDPRREDGKGFVLSGHRPGRPFESKDCLVPANLSCEGQKRDGVSGP